MSLIDLAGSAHEGSASVQVTGDLTDGDAVTDLLAHCRAAMKKARKGLIIDLTNVEAADTKLVAALVMLRRWAAAIGIELVLHLPRCVQHWLAVCRLEFLGETSAA